MFGGRLLTIGEGVGGYKYERVETRMNPTVLEWNSWHGCKLMLSIWRDRYRNKYRYMCV